MPLHRHPSPASHGAFVPKMPRLKATAPHVPSHSWPCLSDLGRDFVSLPPEEIQCRNYEIDLVFYSGKKRFWFQCLREEWFKLRTIGIVLAFGDSTFHTYLHIAKRIGIIGGVSKSSLRVDTQNLEINGKTWKNKSDDLLILSGLAVCSFSWSILWLLWSNAVKLYEDVPILLVSDACLSRAKLVVLTTLTSKSKVVLVLRPWVKQSRYKYIKWHVLKDTSKLHKGRRKSMLNHATKRRSIPTAPGFQLFCPRILEKTPQNHIIVLKPGRTDFPGQDSLPTSHFKKIMNHNTNRLWFNNKYKITITIMMTYTNNGQ